MLDLWEDAAHIAHRLQQPGMRLVLGVGAENCLKCALLHALFQQHASAAPAGELWLWLWREEHRQFLGGTALTDPPRFWIYRDAQLLHSGPVDEANIGSSRESFIGAVPRHLPGTPLGHDDIRQRLLAEDWAG